MMGSHGSQAVGGDGGVRWRLAERRRRGSWETTYFIPVYFIFTLCDDTIELCIMESRRTFGSHVLELSKT